MTFEELGIVNDMPKGWSQGKDQPLWHKKVYHMWYSRWYKCKNSNNNMYKYYKDCNIHEDFRYLSNFVTWIMNEPRFDEFTQTCDKVMWCIDKDAKDPNNRNYYPECMTLCTFEENTKEMLNRRGNIVSIIAIYDKNKILLFKSIRDAKYKGFDSRNINKCLKGSYKTHKGYRWYKVNYSHNKIFRLKEGDILERIR